MGWGGRQAGIQMEAETKQDSKSHSKTWSHEAWTHILAVLGDLSRKVSFIFSLVLHLPRVPLLSLPALLLVWLIESPVYGISLPYVLILTRKLSIF